MAENATRAFVCGHPIAHSRSPKIHGYWLAKYGIRGSYSSIDVAPAEEGSGLEIQADQPGVQFYTGNFLDDKLAAKPGKPYAKHSGFCLETQHYPDSPNQPEFPSTVLRPGEEYNSKTVYTFSVR